MSSVGRRWDTVVVWFRRDLRVADHPALNEAVRHARRVVPLFVVDERLMGISAARAWFLSRSVLALDESLRSLGSGLSVRSGPAAQVVADVARDLRADAVLASRDITPRSHRRDGDVAAALARDDRRLLLLEGTLLVEPETLLTGGGTPYRVFTPFWRALERAPRRDVLPAPVAIPTDRAALEATEIPASLQPGSVPYTSLPEGGEQAGQARLQRWVGAGVHAYGERRDDLDGDGSSHLGVDLHFGTLSPGQVEHAAVSTGVDVTPFTRQLAWREFYHHQTFHGRKTSDRVSDSPYMAAFRSEHDDPDAVAAWRAGHTGIPVVDAGMRQLERTAWLSNRARLVVASFLTRHLLMDYRIGERHFLRHLVDGDVANNLGGWQWTAGVGADAQPWFRIFNPVRQGRRFDPEGDWVRRWVPELADVPSRYVHAPWEMPDDIAQRAGVQLGSTYAWPIVDLAEGRARALAAFRSVRP